MRLAMTDAEIEKRLDMLDRLLPGAPAAQLPTLNAAYQRLLEEQARRDLEREDAQISGGL